MEAASEDYEVIVVDNNSSDDSFPFLSDRYGGDVTFIRNTENLGFGKACNQGAKAARSKYLLFLNPDTIVPVETIPQCISTMEANTRLGAMGVKLVDGSGRYLSESKRAFPSLWNSFCKLTGLSSLFPDNAIFGGYNLRHLAQNKNHSIDVLCGAFMLVRKKAFQEVKGFDEDYFMYGEDIDLCKRLKEKDWEIYYRSDLEVIHFKGESNKEKNAKYYKQFYSAMSIYADKHFSPLTALFLKAAISGASAFALAVRYIRVKAWMILDFIMLFLLFQGLKLLWAYFKFESFLYYEHTRFYYLSIIAVLILQASLITTGYYRKRASFRHLFSGIMFGGLLILALYGILPVEWRFSRAVFLFFFPMALIVLVFASGIKNWFLKGSWSIIGYGRRKLAYVGEVIHYQSLKNLIDNTSDKLELVGRISSEVNPNATSVIGHMDQIEELISDYQLDDLVFGIDERGFDAIFPLLNRFGHKVKFNILGSDGLSMIGSNDPGMAGDLYLVEVGFAINEQSSKLLKLILDKLLSIVCLIFQPLLIFRKKILIKEAFYVLLGKCTWVGYDNNDVNLHELPKLKKAILPVTLKIVARNMTSKSIQLHNFKYAKNYSVFWDIDLFFYYVFLKDNL